MKQIVKAFIHAHPNPYAEPGQLPITLQCWGVDMANYGYALLEIRDLEIELSDGGKQAIDKAYGKAVEAREKQIVSIQKKADDEISSVCNDIAKLCALTYSSQPETPDVP